MDGIEIDTAKVKAIWNWNTLICVKDVRTFIGFYNFYWRFILNFLKITGLLNTLTRKNVSFEWFFKCEKAFQKLKQCMCKALILCHFDPNKQCFDEIDFSDYINASVLSQLDSNDILYLITYFFFEKYLQPNAITKFMTRNCSQLFDASKNRSQS